MFSSVENLSHEPIREPVVTPLQPRNFKIQQNRDVDLDVHKISIDIYSFRIELVGQFIAIVIAISSYICWIISQLDLKNDQGK